MVEDEFSDTDFKLFQELIYSLTGISLTDTKRSLVQGRLQKRLHQLQIDRYQEYYQLVVLDGPGGSETTEIINCITTNKTDFFREPHHFDYVRQTLVPDLVRSARAGERARTIRVWHAGCSTGEEPYSMAITLSDALEGYGDWDVRLLASDIDTAVLAHAQAGIYDQERVAAVPEATVRKHFLRGNGESSGKVMARPDLKSKICFRRINLLSDPWPIRADTQFDVIFCRNVVIYFDKPTQRKLFSRMTRYLRPGGHLFIGHSETLLGISNAFHSLGKTMYQLQCENGYEAKAA